MRQFMDQNGCQVRITFDGKLNVTEVGHVWVVCRYEDRWLLTQHRNRGIEFPGGKIEDGETVRAAAKREVFEETGALIDSLYEIGQYEVTCGEERIWKDIYYATVAELQEKEDYLETNGPILLDQFPEDIQTNLCFSFMMRDEVLPLVLTEIAKRELI